jgi:hypothetical protein
MILAIENNNGRPQIQKYDVYASSGSGYDVDVMQQE